MRFRGAMLLGVGLTLLLAAWVFATPPFDGPDEASHYLRALNIAHGELLGPKIGYPPSQFLSAAQLTFSDKDTRAVMVPAGLSPSNVRCIDGKPDLSGRCIEPTPTGDYYPPAYLLPAVVLTAAHTATAGLWRSRLASAGACLAFILLAAGLLASETAWSLLGLVAAITPMVLFVGSVINPSGLEIASSLAFAASVLRITRSPERVPRPVWMVLSFSGAVTILSWQAGPGFAIADVLVGAALLGRTGLRQLRSSSGRELAWSTVVLGLATVAYLIYGRISGVAHSHFGITPIGQSLRQGLHQLPNALHDAVGVFGSLTIRLPGYAYWTWWLIILGLLLAALRLSGRRERVIALMVTALALALTVVAWAWVYRFSGFGLQGRQVLPLLMLVPVMAGEVVYRHINREPTRRPVNWALASTLGAIAAFQLFAWWMNARFWAGEPHALWFLAHPKWSPPLGWWPWTTSASLGTFALLGMAGQQLRRPGKIQAA